MKKRRIWTLNTFLYAMWVFFVLGTGLYATHWDAMPWHLIGRFWMLLAGVAVLPPLLMRKIREWRPGKPGRASRLPVWAFRTICFCCSLLVLGFCFLAVKPGGFDGDPGNQLRQALTGQYSDYRPVTHTLIAFKLPLTLTGGWIPSIILFQILLFSAALTCVCDTVRRYAGTLWGFLSLAAVLLNPITQSFLMYGYKDETFGICAMLLVCMNARILFSRGEWLKKPLHLVGFTVILALTCLVRYNGILFALPCLAGAALCASWKKSLAAGAAALLIIAGVRGPLSSAIGVERTEDRSSQTMGLPMSVIGGAVTYRPEKLDDELLAFAYSVAPREVWEEKYSWGDYNWVDWDPRSNHQAVADAGMAGVLKYMLRALREAPKESLKALIETTDIVYGLMPDKQPDGRVFVGGADLGLRNEGIPWMEKVMEWYRGLIYLMAPHAFLHSGVTLFLLMTFAMARWPLNRKGSWKRLMPVLSIFVYNLGTMLMLFAWWDGARFFHYSLWVAPVLLVMLIQEDGTEEMLEGRREKDASRDWPAGGNAAAGEALPGGRQGADSAAFSGRADGGSSGRAAGAGHGPVQQILLA